MSAEVSSEGMFSGMGETDPSVGGIYITEGNYTDIEILAVKTINTRKNGRAFCIETMVHQSAGEKAIKPGIKCSQMFMEKQDSFKANVKAFLIAAFSQKIGRQSTKEEVGEKEAAWATSKDQPLAGLHLKAQAVNIKTQKGNDFTRVDWSWSGAVATPEAKSA